MKSIDCMCSIPSDGEYIRKIRLDPLAIYGTDVVSDEELEATLLLHANKMVKISQAIVICYDEGVYWVPRVDWLRMYRRGIIKIWRRRG